MVEELSSGSCVAMEVVAKQSNVNTAIEFRKLVGPPDPVSVVFLNNVSNIVALRSLYKVYNNIIFCFCRKMHQVIF